MAQTIENPSHPVKFEPRITGISPTSGKIGSKVKITGKGFFPKQGTHLGTSRVVFSSPRTSAQYAEIASWSDTAVEVFVPRLPLGGVEVSMTVGDAGSVYLVNDKPATLDFSIVDEEPKTAPAPVKTVEKPVPPLNVTQAGATPVKAATPPQEAK